MGGLSHLKNARQVRIPETFQPFKNPLEKNQILGTGPESPRAVESR